MSTELSAYYQRTLDELNDAIALSSLAGFIIGHAPPHSDCDLFPACLGVISFATKS